MSQSLQNGESIRGLHAKRREALLQRNSELYSAFFWDDSILFVFDHRMTLDQMRRRLPLLAAGSEAVTVEFPPIEDLALSETGDAVTTSFRWKTRIRNSEGAVFDRVNYETDVWYQRDGVWKIVCMHLTNLASERVD